MNNQQTLRQCFQTALELKATDAVEALAYGASPVWDSVAHTVLVAELESSFGVELTPEDILHITSFQKAQQVLAGRGVSFE
jgi:acyl carrier protein